MGEEGREESWDGGACTTARGREIGKLSIQNCLQPFLKNPQKRKELEEERQALAIFVNKL